MNLGEIYKKMKIPKFWCYDTDTKDRFHNIHNTDFQGYNVLVALKRTQMQIIHSETNIISAVVMSKIKGFFFLLLLFNICFPCESSLITILYIDMQKKSHMYGNLLLAVL